MKKKSNLILLAMFVLMPTLVFASSNDDVGIGFAIFTELFITIHMIVFFLWPLSNLISKDDSKKTLIRLIILRFVLLLIFDFISPEKTMITDTMLVFVGAFIIIPILSVTKKVINPYGALIKKVPPLSNNYSSIINDKTQCPKCQTILSPSDKTCPNCGTEYVKESYVTPSSFDNLYMQTENFILETLINREIKNSAIDTQENQIPSNLLKRKNILNIIFSILTCLYITLVFFHFPLLTYIIGLVILLIFFFLTRNVTLVKVIMREVKARPNEKISDIVMSYKENLVKDTSKQFFKIGLIIAIIIPCLVFIEPRILYEAQGDGYAVRFYTFGLTNFTRVTIPEKYNGKNVIALRGNTFSNMPFLKEVNLPDTIVEIRGQAFKNDYSLKEVKLPSKLEYLGGGAFYNCHSLLKISLPDTLNEMGGETFYKATNLVYVKLSQNLTEIRGSTFEECTSLTAIDIPDKITRIGGHAFYGASSLNKVNISENSQLLEIGSSAFRRCNSLYNITLPYQTSVNERTFKESPTVIKRYPSKDEQENLSFMTNKTFGIGKSQNIYLNTGESISIKLLSVSSENYDSSWFYVKNGVTNYFNIPLNNQPRDVDDFTFTATQYTDSYVTINIEKKVGDYNA